ncbi:nuclear transport factor 2 family protein [Lutispora thermophila]|uniref:SnoaL-like domain-containing protein n=1 Tax=Lutispora thermophila DSM 19022 TaxID=1122184 RepID=A0A1M6BCI3_9FIRM|nr:nuclear transport factor 2 family protein [Lutispora thermophila]SHI46429.1 SnoaL-like domain-containing protein [Lutispora thermophila DSM 19022]
MKSFGIQYLNKLSEIPVEKNNMLQESNTESLEIREVLRQFQAGYTKRDIKNIDDYVKELFIKSDDTYVLGTGTGELFLGIEQVKTLLKNDWEYWGDVNIDLENIHIDIENEVAWFATTGTVKYTFQDTEERYDNYINFIKNKTKESELTGKQKVAFINWVLALTYHQRIDKQREYLWALGLSGVLLKDNGKWKFAQIHFSIPKSDFPDERFENSKEYIINYNNQNAIADKYLNSKSQIDKEIKSLLESLETELFGQQYISKELISKYFTIDSAPYIIETDNKCCIGAEQIKEFFDMNSGTTLALDLEHAIVSKQNGITWVTVCGLLKGSLTEEKLYERVLDEIDNLFQANISSKDKLFAIHRSVSYVLKESAAGENYTCPIRLTAVVKNCMERPVFQNIHFSFPCYWIFEGKLDSL